MRLITAPSNLGLRPLTPGHEPGTWRAPAALIDAGLIEALGTPRLTALPRPPYSPAAQAGTRIRNGQTLRQFNLALADAVREARRAGQFVLVVGGDCSILLGALAGAREHDKLALVHLDGHSDFRHPGNYDFQNQLGAAAGMDLALATGRGEQLATHWPGLARPLVEDADVIQIGERESRDADYAWPDINGTAIRCIDVFEAKAIGTSGISRQIADLIAARPRHGVWVHLDIDVLDQAFMPAVDSPGSPGLLPEDLVAILTPLVAHPRCCGMTLTVFDPDLDPDGRYAAIIVALLAQLPFPTARANAPASP